MAWRDTRGSRRNLLLFVSSMIVGVAALVAITSFRSNLLRAIDEEAQGLFGADMSLESSRPFVPETEALIDSIGGEQARRTSFFSVALFPESGASRLSMVRALEGAYPFYGSIVTEPLSAVETWRSGRRALLDRGMMRTYDVALGDSVQIGRFRYEVVGAIIRTPRETTASMLISPPIYIARSQLDTSLVSFGSQASYEVYFKLDPSVNVEALRDDLADHRREFEVGMDTVEEEREDWSEVLGGVTRFLGLAGFIALLLGGLGVGSAIHVYVKKRLTTVAVLRCMGASVRRTVWVYLAQAAAMGVLAGIVGCVAGSVLQLALPGVLADFLPTETDMRLSMKAIVLGMCAGPGSSILFALLPLLTVRRIPPLAALRSAFEERRKRWDIGRTLVYAVVAAGVVILAAMQAQDILVGVGYAVFLGTALGALWLLAWGLVKLAPRLVPNAYVWRQGIANLHRPKNQTLLMMVTLGLGSFLVLTIMQVEGTLLASFARANSEDRPDMVLFNIRSDERAGVEQLTLDQDLPIVESAPLVSMRIYSVGSQLVDSLRADTTQRSNWAFFREYRSTYRSGVTDAEQVVRGEFIGSHEGTGPVPVSIERDLAEEQLEVGIGDTIVFDVQGSLVETTVASYREVDWQQTRANFFVVFPEGVLEEAPHTHVIMTRTGTDAKLAQYQGTMAAAYPSVTAISLSLILGILDEIYARVQQVVRFMALFSVVAGMLVLVGSIMTSRYRRLEESVLLKTLGASRRQVLAIVSVEYLVLGVLAAVAGILLSVGAAATLATHVFELPYAFVPGPLVGTLVLVPVLTIALGLINSRGIYKRSVLEVLRTEV